MASSVAGHIRAFGEDIVPGCYEDIEEADLVVLVGSNAAWCHPVLYQRLAAAKRGARHQDRRHRPAPHRDLRDRRPASRDPSRLRRRGVRRRCCSIWSRAAPATATSSARARTGFAAALEAARARAPSLADAARDRRCRPSDLARFYDWFAAHRAHASRSIRRA